MAVLLNNCNGLHNYNHDYAVHFAKYAQYKNVIKVGRPAVIVDKIGDDLYTKRIIKITKLGRVTDETLPKEKQYQVTIDGTEVSIETMTKAQLIEDKFTAKLFTKDGGFKRGVSVI